MSFKLIAILFTLLISACGGGTSGTSKPEKSPETSEEAEALPEINEVPIEAPIVREVERIEDTSNKTPSYTFYTSQYGNIKYFGGCSSDNSVADKGNNEIQFDALLPGYYSYCTIQIVSETGVESIPLNISPFRILDVEAPILREVLAIGDSRSNNPMYQFESSESGRIHYSGSCESAIVNANAGLNTITFFSLAEGIHSNCNINVEDSSGNISAPLEITAFKILDTTPPVIADLSKVDSEIRFYNPFVGFSLSEEGVLVLGGSCGEKSYQVRQGRNLIALEAVRDGYYSGCEFYVLDAAGNKSDIIIVNTFRILDFEGPILKEESEIGDVKVNAPSYYFTSNEAGSVTYEGSCVSITDSMKVGTNKITFNYLEEGSYEDCEIYAKDMHGNRSKVLKVSPFTILDHTPPYFRSINYQKQYRTYYPYIKISVTEDADIFFEGSCRSDRKRVYLNPSNYTNTNNIAFDYLPEGFYDDCRFYLIDDAGNRSSKKGWSFTILDSTSPVLSELIALDSVNQSFIKYKYSSTEAGSVLLSGGCISTDDSAIEGENELILSHLENGEYENCLLSVTDDSGNVSNSLMMTKFIVFDSTAPVISTNQEYDKIIKTLTPEFLFNSSEEGDLVASGDCRISKPTVNKGDNTVILIYDASGVFSDCTLSVVDRNGNQSNTLSVPLITIEEGLSKVKYEINFDDAVATLEFKEGVLGYQLESSDYDNCLSDQCGFSYLLNSKEINLPLSSIENHDYLLRSEVNDVVSYSAGTFSMNKFSRRRDPGVVEYNNSMWLIGGESGSFDQINDVWSSTNGINWNLESDNTKLPDVNSRIVKEFKGALWLVGDSYENKVSKLWKSHDGEHWEELTSYLPKDFYRVKFMGVHNGQLWMWAGTDSATSKLLRSYDGLNWKEVNPDFIDKRDIGYRNDISIYVYKSKLWIKQYNTQQETGYEFWSSKDGKIWSLEYTDSEASGFPIVVENKLFLIHLGSSRYSMSCSVSENGYDWVHHDLSSSRQDPIFKYRKGYSAFSFKKQLLITAGSSDYNGWFNDVWASSDCASWNVLNAKFRPMYDFSLRSFNDKLMVFNGIMADEGAARTEISTETWMSDDGVAWEQYERISLLGSAVVEFNGRLFSIMGLYNKSQGAGVSYSSDGKFWSYTVDDVNDPSKRRDALSVTFNNKIWIYGGFSDLGKSNTILDVWWSSDGEFWTESTKSANYIPDPRFSKILSFAGTLWAFDGRNKTARFSTDGIQWSKESRVLAFPKGDQFSVIEYDNKIMHFSKFGIWVSEDGLNWSELMSDPAYNSYDMFEVIVHKNELVVIGGYDKGNQLINDVWYSKDGVSWKQRAKGELYFP